MSECKIVAVLNRKGGVCKTTTTHNLGVALVQRGYRVLLVDCDTQRNLSISLGLNRPDEECYTLCELLQPLIDVEVDEVIFKTASTILKTEWILFPISRLCLLWKSKSVH